MDVTQVSEQRLIEQARQGDQAAYEALVRRHYDGVIQVVYRMCGDPQAAEDAAQEAFVRAWLNLPSFQPHRSPSPAPFRSWVYRIAVNAALDAHRRRRTDALNDDLLAFQADPAPGPEAALLEKEQAARVQAAVLALPEAARSALVLREYGGLAYGEIAAALDIPTGTVMSRLNYARSLLRKTLAGVPLEVELENA